MKHSSRASGRFHRPALRARPEPRPSGPAPNRLVTKGDEVEEWLDLHFFRPIGARIAHRLARTRTTADQVTFLSLVIGLVAGHLFVYTSPWLNAAGFVLEYDAVRPLGPTSRGWRLGINFQPGF